MKFQLFLVLWIYSSYLLSQTVQLTVKVVDKNKVGISGASVEIEQINTTELTDDNGNHIFFDVPVGQLKIRVSKTGYKTETATDRKVDYEKKTNVVEIELKAVEFETKSLIANGSPVNQSGHQVNNSPNTTINNSPVTNNFSTKVETADFTWIIVKIETLNKLEQNRSEVIDILKKSSSEPNIKRIDSLITAKSLFKSMYFINYDCPITLNSIFLKIIDPNINFLKILPMNGMLSSHYLSDNKGFRMYEIYQPTNQNYSVLIYSIEPIIPGTSFKLSKNKEE